MARHLRDDLRTLLSWLMRLSVPCALAAPCFWAPGLCVILLPLAVIVGGVVIEQGLYGD